MSPRVAEIGFVLDGKPSRSSEARGQALGTCTRFISLYFLLPVPRKPVKYAFTLQNWNFVTWISFPRGEWASLHGVRVVSFPEGQLSTWGLV